MTKVYADLADNGKRIDVYFRYDPEAVEAVKTVPGYQFIDKTKGGPLWRFPLDFSVAKALRKAFGSNLEVGDELKAWGIVQRRKEDQLSLLASATDTELSVLPEVLPDLYDWLRPYQRAGAAFLAVADASLIADQPGLGKTVQAIAGIYEAGMASGPHLVVAPLVSLESVWRKELERWQPNPVWVPSGNREQREAVLTDFVQYVEEIDTAAWLVVNPQMVAYRREAPTCKECNRPMKKERGEFYRCEECFASGTADMVPSFSAIHSVDWKTVTVDECHKNAVRNPKTLTARAMFKLSAEKRIAMSGTPIANRPIDLWGVLHFLLPDTFSSKWRWAYQWLEIEENRYGKTIGGIREDRKEDFFRSLTPYVLRRTRGEVFPELPAEQLIDLWCDMTPAQAKQYEAFAKDAELRIEEEELTAFEKIVEYIRLKQFAVAKQELRNEDGKVVPYPTEDSGKFEMLAELLEERGILEGERDDAIVIFSQFERVVDKIMDWLKAQGVDALKLAGEQNRKRGLAEEIQTQFQDRNGPPVLVMTTQTGGVSITLDRANACAFMDETWTASEMEQAIARLRPQSPARMDRPEEKVAAYFLRTKGTIDEYIFELVAGKGIDAEEILDGRRKLRLY